MMLKGRAPLMMRWIQQRLINGSQVTLPESFSFYVSFSIRDNYSGRLVDILDIKTA